MSLNSLLGGGRRRDIYVSVSPACGLEVLEVDNSGVIRTYAQAPLDYNDAAREIASYDTFKTSLIDLLQSRNIDPSKINVHLNLPTVWFGLKEGIQLLLDDNAITNIVTGELEQSYVFKRKTPLPYWFDAQVSDKLDSRDVFYTAVQQEVIAEISEILTSIGAVLVSVGCSMFADLKGLYVTGLAREQMETDDCSWTLMIINNSGFQLLSLQGKKLLEYYEEPMPLKSFEGEEVYTEIENAAQIALMSSPSSSLVIVSETNLVSAELLRERLQFSGQTIAVEDNQYRKEPLADFGLNVLPDDQVKVSLSAYGSTAPSGLINQDVNFLGAGDKPVEVATIFGITPQVATIISLILLVIVGGILYFSAGATEKMLNDVQAKSAEIDTQISAIDEQINQKQSGSEGKTAFDPVEEIARTLKNNRTKIMAYAALGESVPKTLYLTYFITGDDGLIAIKGCANTVEDVYVFFKNLKDSLVDSNLRVSNLGLRSGSLDKVVNDTISPYDSAPYIFEITNMTDSQMQSFMDKLTNTTSTTTSENGDQNSGDNAQQNQQNTENKQ